MRLPWHLLNLIAITLLIFVILWVIGALRLSPNTPYFVVWLKSSDRPTPHSIYTNELATTKPPPPLQSEQK